jgi:hypothetical protein
LLLALLTATACLTRLPTTLLTTTLLTAALLTASLTTTLLTAALLTASLTATLLPTALLTSTLLPTGAAGLWIGGTFSRTSCLSALATLISTRLATAGLTVARFIVAGFPPPA